MEPTGGDLARHDHEFDQVRWIDFDEAAVTLTFETERALVAQAGRSIDGRTASSTVQHSAAEATS
jgi:hypothetical protein